MAVMTLDGNWKPWEVVGARNCKDWCRDGWGKDMMEVLIVAEKEEW